MRAGIIGATGYAGAEITRLLAGHPRIDGLALSSTSFEGEAFSSVYPNFLGRIDAKLEKSELVIEKSDVVFGALPNTTAEAYAALCVKKGVPFIDMSADFRFESEDIYAKWYGSRWKEPALHQKSVYGLSEFNRKLIKERALQSGGSKPAPVVIGNPGCYPTCASLAAWPALKRGIAACGTIIVDAVSGITGGGREPQRSFHYPECADSCTAYKAGSHRHTPEIRRNFSAMAGGAREAIFTPHLAPMNRGILATLYIPLEKRYQGTDAKKLAEIRGIYAEFYAEERFVRILPEGLCAATGRLRGSNYCDIGIHRDEGGTTLILTAAIDNMIKGAAGQAVQNMNIIFGFDEADGLNYQSALF
jgi:N-acetyl-gamma-glutamyl-phosphate reductase